MTRELAGEFGFISNGDWGGAPVEDKKVTIDNGERSGITQDESYPVHFPAGPSR